MDKKRKNWNIPGKVWISLMAVAVLFVSLFMGATNSYADSSVKAWVVNYATQTATGNDLRTASLMEVKTSGFSKDAQLSYSYALSGTLILAPFLVYQSYASPDQSKLQNMWADGPYFAKTGSGSSKVKITVTVTDKNEKSSTYNKKAVAVVNGFKKSDISKDFNAVGYGLCGIGDSMKVRELLGRGGMLHVADCDEPYCYVRYCTLKSGGDKITISDATTNGGKDWRVTATDYGESAVNVRIDKADGCTFHGGTGVEGTMYIFCFKEPEVTPHYSDELIIGNTMKGVTYTVNGQSKTCTEDGEKLTFAGLQPSTNYEVICSYILSNGKKAQIFSHGITNGLSIVSFDTKGKGNKEISDLQVMAGKTLTEPTGIYENGYYISGWYTDINYDSEPWDFANDLVEDNMVLYAKWDKIPNRMDVTVKKNKTAWSGQKVSLYKGGSESYELTEKNGVYTSDKVINGTYEIYVNDCPTGEKVTFDCQGKTLSDAQKKSAVIEYDAAEITTLLDGKQSGKPGEITAVQGDTVLMKAKNENGKTELALLSTKAGEAFDVYVDGIKTGKSVSKNDKLTIEFYEITLNVTSDTAWENADFTMRDSGGNIKNYFKYESTSDNNTVYYCILQKDENETPESYEVYEGDRAIHRTADAVKNHVLSAKFYQASLTLYYDDELKAGEQVSISDGTDVYTLKGSGGEYKEEHVLVNETDGKEQPYAAEVKDAVDNAPLQFTTAAPKAELKYYSVVGQIVRANGAYATAFRQIVRAGDTLSEPSLPDTGGVRLEGWYKDSAYTEAFDFTSGVTQKMTLFGKMETPEVILNGYVKCDEDGTTDGSGSWYKLSNLSITGFKKTGRIKSVTIDVTDCKTIRLLDTSQVKLSEQAENGAVSITDGSLVVRFTGKKTMAEVQEYLRTNLLIEPGTEHTVKITVNGETY